MKKLISLALCLVLALSLTVGSASAAYFADQGDIRHSEAVKNCTALNIFNGYEDGTFRPNNNITREEMCKMLAVLLNGGKETYFSHDPSVFSDVSSGHWSLPYINYCYEKGLVAGMNGGIFKPNGNVTTTQAAKMLLVSLGYKPGPYVGGDWAFYVQRDANSIGMFDGLTNPDKNAALSRDDAAQLIWNALHANVVRYATVGDDIAVYPLTATLLTYCYPNYADILGSIPDNPTPDDPTPDTPSKVMVLADYVGMTRSEIAKMWGSDYTEEQGGDMGADSTLNYADWRVPADFSLLGDTVATVFCFPSDMGSGFTLTDTITGKESYTQLREKGITGRFVTEDNDPDGDLCWNYEETAFFMFEYGGKFFYFSWLNDDPYTSPANFLFVGDADEMVN